MLAGGVRDASSRPRSAIRFATQNAVRDVIFIAVVIAFFALAALFVCGCAWDSRSAGGGGGGR